MEHIKKAIEELKETPQFLQLDEEQQELLLSQLEDLQFLTLTEWEPAEGYIRSIFDAEGVEDPASPEAKAVSKAWTQFFTDFLSYLTEAFMNETAGHHGEFQVALTRASIFSQVMAHVIGMTPDEFDGSVVWREVGHDL